MIAELRGTDPRPLLIVRPADDERIDSLLQAALKSERFQLASQWFHCIRLEVQNVEESRYASLFARRRPPHMILSTWDGTQRVELLGSVGQKVTWAKITGILRREYREDPTRAVKDLEKLLNGFDALDKREAELTEQLARCKEAGKEDQCKKIESQLQELRGEREELEKEEKDLADLQLRKQTAEEPAIPGH